MHKWKQFIEKNEQNITLLEEIIEQKKKNNEKNLNLEIIIEKPESKAELEHVNLRKILSIDI